MEKFRPFDIEAPDYDYSVSLIVDEFKKAIAKIETELLRLDLTEISRANALATMSNINDILKELNKESAKWAEENIPLAARNGVASAIFSIGAAESLAEAYRVAQFNKLNKEYLKSVIADTQSDLLQVTQNMSRKTKQAIQQAVATSMRESFAEGVNAPGSIKLTTLKNLRNVLGTAVNTGIIDASGRRWRPEVYVDTVVRTKLLYAHIESTTNESVSRGIMYGVISSHGAKDNCKLWEGRTVKLVDSAPGPYPTVDSLRGGGRGEIFHPRCKHVIIPKSNPN